MTYENIRVETRDRIGIVTLDRPKAMNALSDALMSEVGAAVEAFEGDDAVSVIVLTGSEKAFAAGADIKDMGEQDFYGLFRGDFPSARGWGAVKNARKPVIAAVAGYALGGGCELAMTCDMIIAADTAKFGQPEIKIGTMPGAGGTQRLTRAVGKAKAMEMCLTGRMMDAEEAERSGLVTRVVPAAELMDETLKTANAIAAQSLPMVMMVKESVNQAFETPLESGLKFERRLFHSTFATEDRAEGMKAFVEKRKPDFRNR
ncbi:MAG: enoyl-CoA hydratase [Ectothiorhodospiraceae bacterium]|jgi:enoyl-CoA hydratase